jgi:hypothetical protein
MGLGYRVDGLMETITMDAEFSFIRLIGFVLAGALAGIALAMLVEVIVQTFRDRD